MHEYTYADVIIDPADPRVEIGKEYYSAIASKDVLDFANHNEELAKLIEVDPGIKYPFHIKSDCCDCWTCLLIRKKEPEKKYVPFDLSKPEVRDRLRGQQIRRKPYSFNPGYWTLTEFANELRKIFKFKYLTVESTFGRLYFAAWTRKPLWNGKRGYMFWHRREDVYMFLAANFFNTFLAEEIDLSEYADKDGNIDYSKCIVEVIEE